MNALTLAVLAVSFAIMYHDLERELDSNAAVLAAVYWFCWVALVGASLILVVP